ncbi:sugar phosphate isomerase/epimerase family protein [Sulfitobacter guttiformis]|uniref:Sugar phosphate isomerase/epimerase n=1 Tax=Sulfitobacter guttiformis TaxID=74349 RepID=A0A420DHH9_9RHOB|nr:sugar phosphate isomerase/epimerase family protein [Sulfitobacter guttiformis]KIN72588.1 Sugar phosphate isomerase/epimerase [Sulfitobacter guttiformis KCTC 32187]RKE93670.1 sugar phosphate isomerase/epimerase [Sulfitobacter guttiformis]
MTDLPLLGAAMPTATLETLQDFILSENRDLEIQDFCDADLLNGDWKAVADHTRTLLTGYTGRLGIHGPFWGLNIASPDTEMRALNRRKHLQGIEVCEYLGATQMVIHSPYTTWSYNNLDNGPERKEYDRVVENCHDTMKDVVKRAEDCGVTMVIENIEDIDPDIRCALADSFNSPAMAVSIDTGHAHYAHGTNGAAPVDYYVRRAANRLQHIHLQDADGYADRHWAIGEGSISWQAVFRALGEFENSPRLILELRDKAGILPSVAHLQNLGLAR